MYVLYLSAERSRRSSAEPCCLNKGKKKLLSLYIFIWTNLYCRIQIIIYAKTHIFNQIPFLICLFKGTEFWKILLYWVKNSMMFWDPLSKLFGQLLSVAYGCVSKVSHYIFLDRDQITNHLTSVQIFLVEKNKIPCEFQEKHHISLLAHHLTL